MHELRQSHCPIGALMWSAISSNRAIAEVEAELFPAVFLENVSDPRLMCQIASETGAAIGGTLFSDSLTKENGEAPSYIEMVRHNVSTIVSACGLTRTGRKQGN